MSYHSDRHYIESQFNRLKRQQAYHREQQAIRDQELNDALFEGEMRQADHDIMQQLLYLQEHNPIAYKAALETKMQAEQQYHDAYMAALNGDYKMNEGEFVDEEQNTEKENPFDVPFY